MCVRMRPFIFRCLPPLFLSHQSIIVLSIVSDGSLLALYGSDNRSRLPIKQVQKDHHSVYITTVWRAFSNCLLWINWWVHTLLVIICSYMNTPLCLRTILLIRLKVKINKKQQQNSFWRFTLLGENFDYYLLLLLWIHQISIISLFICNVIAGFRCKIHVQHA